MQNSLSQTYEILIQKRRYFKRERKQLAVAVASTKQNAVFALRSVTRKKLHATKPNAKFRQFCRHELRVASYA